MKELPIISVKEARKLLGKEAQDMDDEQVMQVVLLLTDVAKAYLEQNTIKLRKGQ
jgi:hypothetical protein